MDLINTEKLADDVRYRMRKAVQDAGYTIAGFAEENGMSAMTFYGKKRSLPLAFTILLISEKCNVSCDYLLKRSDT